MARPKRENPLGPIQKKRAREEMNHYLRDAGITGRSLKLIDAMIAIVIALETEKEPS